MTVMLRSLKVTSEMDVSGFSRGAAQQVAAERSLISAAEARGAAFASADAKMQNAIPGMARLSRAFIEGYSATEKFERALRQIDNAMGQSNKGMPADRAALIYTNLAGKFGVVANAIDLARNKMVSLAPVVDEVNRKLEAQATIADRAAKAVRDAATAQGYQGGINQRLGVRDDFGGAARAADIAVYGQELDRLRSKYAPIEAAMAGYQQEITDVDQALKVGAISLSSYSAAIEQARQKLQSYKSGGAEGGISAERLLGIQMSGQSAQASAAAFREATRALEEEEAAISRVNAEMDRRAKISLAASIEQAAGIERLRAKYDPLSVAMEGYRREVDAIAAAEKQGIISKQAMAQSIVAAQQALQNTSLRSSPQVDQTALNRTLGIRDTGAGSARQSAAAFQEAAAEAERMAPAVAALRAQIDPLAAATDRMNAELAEYTAMLNVGAISTAEFAAAQQLAQQRLLRTSQALGHISANARLNRHEMANLSYQFNDIAVMMASGQAPFMLLMQQGMQIGQIIGPQGLQAGIRSLGAGIFAFLTNPVNLAVIGFAGLVAGATYFFREMKSGLPTVGDMVDKLKASLSELGGAYEAIGRTVGGISPESTLVLEVEARLNVAKAKEVIGKQFEEIRDTLKYTAMASEARKDPLNIFGYFMGSLGDVSTLRKAMDDMETRLMTGKMSVQQFREEWATFADMNKENKEIQKANEAIMETTKAPDLLQRTINAATRASDALATSLYNLARNPLRLLGEEIKNTALRDFVPDLRSQVEKLNESMAEFKKQSPVTTLFKDGKDSGIFDPESVRRMAEANIAYGKAQAYLNAELVKSETLHVLDLDAMNAKTPAELAAIARRRVYADAINTNLKGLELEEAAMRASEMAFRQATQAIADQNRERLRAAQENILNSRFEIELIGKTAGEVAVLRANWAAYLDLKRQEETSGFFDQEQLDLLMKYNAELANTTRLLNEAKFEEDFAFEWKLAGMSSGEADIARRLKAANIDEGTAKWHEYAEAIRQAKREEQSFFSGMRRGWDDMVNHVNDFAQSGKDIMNTFFGGLEDAWVKFAETGKFSLKDMVRSMLSDLSRLAYKMTMSGILGMLGFGNQAQPGGAGLMGAMFGGGRGAAPGGGAGGLFGSLFGGGGGNGGGGLFGSFFGGPGGGYGGAGGAGSVTGPSVSGGQAGGLGGLLGGFGNLFSHGSGTSGALFRAGGGPGKINAAMGSVAGSLPSSSTMGGLGTAASTGMFGGPLALLGKLFGGGFGGSGVPGTGTSALPQPAGFTSNGSSLENMFSGLLGGGSPAMPRGPGVAGAPSTGGMFSSSADWFKQNFSNYGTGASGFGPGAGSVTPGKVDAGPGGILSQITGLFGSLFGGGSGGGTAGGLRPGSQAANLSKLYLGGFGGVPGGLNDNAPLGSKAGLGSYLSGFGNVPGGPGLKQQLAGVPGASSGPFLDLIGRAEGTDFRPGGLSGRGYNETLSYGAFTGGDRNLTDMNLNQIRDLQKSMLAHPKNAFNSSALGRYQITNRTMMGLREQMQLSGKEMFDPAMQDRMALQLMQGRGANVAGLRNEWVGLNRIPGADILSAYRGQMALMGKNSLMAYNQPAMNPTSWWQTASPMGKMGSPMMGGLGGLGGALPRMATATGGLGGLGSMFMNLFSSLFGMADGGPVTGRGTGRSDSILARLSHGEYVVNADAARRNKPWLDMVNFGRTSPATHANSNIEQGPQKVVNVTQNVNFTASATPNSRKSQNQMAATAQAGVRRAARTA